MWQNVKNWWLRVRVYGGFFVLFTQLSCVIAIILKIKSFKKCVLFKSLIDVASYPPKMLNQFIVSQHRERVGAAAWCSYFYSAIFMPGTFFDGVIYQFWPGDILLFPNSLWIFLKVKKNHNTANIHSWPPRFKNC